MIQFFDMVDILYPEWRTKETRLGSTGEAISLSKLERLSDEYDYGAFQVINDISNFWFLRSLRENYYSKSWNQFNYDNWGSQKVQIDMSMNLKTGEVITLFHPTIQQWIDKIEETAKIDSRMEDFAGRMKAICRSKTQ